MDEKLKTQNSKPKTPKIWNFEFYHWPFSKGFTLIEILVVITIIGILSSVTTFSLKKFNDKGNDARRKGDLKAIQTAAISYYQDNDKFPPNPVSYPANAYSSDIDLGTGWIPGISTYINKLPKDPLRAGIINHFAKNILDPAIGNMQHLAGIFNKSSQSPKTSSNPQVAAIQVMTIRPNGAGTNTAWTTQFPNSTLHWDKVDEPTSDTDSTYIESTIDGQVDTYTHTASGIPAGSTISNVRICVNSKYVTASTNNIAAPALLPSGGSVVWSDQVSTSAYANHCADWATNPVGGSWTIASVDSAQFGMRKSYPTALIRVTQTWMEVTYNTNQPGITSCSITPTTVTVGQNITISATVKNNRSTAIETQGPDSGFTYTEAQSFTSQGYGAISGKFRIGIDNGGGSYPWRWGFGPPSTTTLAAGASTTITGMITMGTTGTKNLSIGLVEESIAWREVGLCPTTVTVNPSAPAATACENKDNIYCYIVNTERSFFVIWAELDNANDLDAVGQAKAICNRAIPANTTFNYCVESSSL